MATLKIINIDKAELSKLGSDFFTVADLEDGIASGLSRAGRADAAKVANMFKAGAAAERLVQATAADAEAVSYGSIAKRHGVVNSTISYGATVARVGLYENGRLDLDNLKPAQAEKVPGQADNLRTFWQFATEGTPLQGQYVTTLGALVGDDGGERADAILRLMRVFGSTSGAYNVATGAKFHEDDPRAQSEDDDQDDQDDEGQDDESGSQSWQEMVAQAARRASEAGASISEVVALVNEVYGA